MKKIRRMLATVLAIGIIASCFAVSASAESYPNFGLATATTTQTDHRPFLVGSIIEYTNVRVSCDTYKANAGIALFASGASTSTPDDQRFGVGTNQRAWWYFRPGLYYLWMRAVYNDGYTVTLNGLFRSYYN